MYKALTGVFLLLTPFLVFAQQKSLLKSRESSLYTYIYKADDQTVESLYRGVPLDENILTAPIDSFLTSKGKEPRLAPGNYLKVFAERGELKYDLIESRSAYLKLLNNRKEIQFVLTDNTGEIITEAQVSIDGKPVYYDQKANLWHARFPRREEKIVRVAYKETANYSAITHDKDGRGVQVGKVWKALSRPVASVALHPLMRLFYKLTGGGVPYRYNSRSAFSGYMVFNKPIYKPGDTVKFKAYLLKGLRHKPLNTPLTVTLNSDSKTQLGEIMPNSPGSYFSFFVLHDSLKLRLDQSYPLQLSSGKKIVKTESFKYSDYELKFISFTIRGDKKLHTKKQPQALYFKALDENGLNVMDGRVELTIEADHISSFYKDQAFVPDTLWRHTFKLDPLGETKVTIPDSIFPDADISYSANAKFLNSNNDETLADAEFDYEVEYDDDDLKFELNNDSLKIDYADTKSRKSSIAIIKGVNSASDTIERSRVLIPCAIKINPFVEEYIVEGDSVYDMFDFEENEGNVSATAKRTLDSLFIQVNNPRKLPVWYALMKGKKVIYRGYTTDEDYRKSFKQNGKIRFYYNYMWGGEEVSKYLDDEFLKKQLHLEITAPPAITPGQRAEIEVSITDPSGKAVEGVDLTAYSITNKFKYRSPYVPYLGKLSRAFKEKSELEEDGGIGQRGIPLNWVSWNKRMGLDSIEYFRFTHPQNTYRYEEDAPEGVTQIAPFIIEKGKPIPVEILYLNNKPVYFSQSGQTNPYSFKVDSGVVFIT